MSYTDKTKLITLDELKELTPMSVNIDDDKLIYAILFAQDNFIEPALGQPLYDEIVDQVTAGSIDAKYVVLLEGNGYAFGGIKVCLGWYAYHKALTNIMYSSTRKGLVKKFDPNSDTLTTSDFNILRSDALNVAENYERGLIEYLKKDMETDTPLYPLYEEGIDNGTTDQPSNSNTGIVL